VLTIPTGYANLGMIDGFDNLAGYDPGVLKRYAQLIYASQGLAPSGATQYLYFQFENESVLRMLRCGLICVDANQPPIVYPNPLPIALLVDECIPLQPDDALRYVTGLQFDPGKSVVLESPPAVQIAHQKGSPGSVLILSQSTDSLELQAELDRPAMLVISDNYSSGWRILPIGQSNQADYQIVPANYAQIGIALQAGKHHFILNYSPLVFRIGRWVSIFSLILFIAVVSFAAISARRRAK